MGENIYMFSDDEIGRRIGLKIRSLRLRQNFTQVELAQQAQISVSTVKKIEEGAIGTLDALMRVLRILGELDVFSSLIKEDELSPNDYLQLIEKIKSRQRRRASTNELKEHTNKKEESEW